MNNLRINQILVAAALVLGLISSNARAERYNLSGIEGGASTHSMIMEVLSTTGTLGTIFFLLIFLKGFKAIKTTALQGDEFFKELAANTKIFLLTLSFGTLYGCSFTSEIYWTWLSFPFLVRSACIAEQDQSTQTLPDA